MSNYKFLMSEVELIEGITSIPATIKQFRDTVQKCSVAAVEYAIVKVDGTYINQIINAVPDKYRATLRQWVSQKGIPLKTDEKGKKVAFNFAKAKAILKERGVEWKPDSSKLKDEDHSQLERLADMAQAQLSGQAWDSALKAEQKEKATKKVVTADSLKKAVDRLAKKAHDAGIGLDEIGIGGQAAVPESLTEVLETILPFAEDTEAVVKITMAIANAVSQLSKKEVKAA